MFRALILSGLLLSSSFFYAQENNRPKVLIGIVVDQMRYDYLLRFQEHFGEGGFNRLMKGGMNLKNTYFNYKPTVTAAGHASIFTGATPSVHGIVANSWYSRTEGDYVYCVTVGNEEERLYTPKRMLSNSIADEIQLGLGLESKVFGVSLKDRGAILPAGHMADGAFWFEGKKGGFISSSYYLNPNPEWVNDFNQADVYEKYLKDGWKLSLDESVYAELEDDRSEEYAFTKEGKSVFPYELKEAYEERGDDLINGLPQGNQILLDFAIELIENEGVGKDDQMDFLSISFSSTDYIGHMFGVRSREVMDVYIKLDRQLEELLNYLDENVGEGEYMLFLTADHGAAINREHLKEMGVPSGYIDLKDIAKYLDNHLDRQFGEEDWVESTANLNIYLDHSLFKGDKDYELEEVIESSIPFLIEQEGIVNVYTAYSENTDDFLMKMSAKGYHPSGSGDLILIQEVNWNSFSAKGSGHESPYVYDTHVPLLFYGKGVRATAVERAHEITDIAPSLASYLGLALPDGCGPYKMIPFNKR